MSNFGDLINIDEYWDKREQFEQERWNVSFFCKDCKQLTDTKRQAPKSYVFHCKQCKWDNIVLWTLEWLKSHYRIK